MPRRSNAFQRLIKYIYSQMAPAGATVTESAMVDEREIDILIEHQIAGHTLRVAVECRGRTKKDDVTWIDDLIGKYNGLPINKVVAVSASGFSPRAKDKAKQHNIDTRTLDEATEADWPSEFVRLGVGVVARQDRFVSAAFTTEPPLSGKAPVDATVVKEGGEVYGTVEAMLRELFEGPVRAKISELLAANWRTLFRVVADLERTVQIEAAGTPAPACLIVIGGNAYRIVNVAFVAQSTFEFHAGKLDHFVFDKAQLSLGTLDSTDEGQPVALLQIAGEEVVRISIPKKKNA